MGLMVSLGDSPWQCGAQLLLGCAGCKLELDSHCQECEIKRVNSRQCHRRCIIGNPGKFGGQQ